MLGIEKIICPGETISDRLMRFFSFLWFLFFAKEFYSGNYQKFEVLFQGQLLFLLV